MTTVTDRTDERRDREVIPTTEPTRAAFEPETEWALRPEAGCLQRWLDLSA
jgi:hypothetical protein